jgi:hypothetical protein
VVYLETKAIDPEDVDSLKPLSRDLVPKQQYY